VVSARNGLPPFSAQVCALIQLIQRIYAESMSVFIARQSRSELGKIRRGLASSSVNDIQILDDGSILRVATHGRGVGNFEVPSSGNTPPTATISSPSAAITVAKGTTVIFSVTSSDADANDQ